LLAEKNGWLRRGSLESVPLIRRRTYSINSILLREAMDVKKVKKAIIQAAGLGTRLLLATKAMPNEMLPIVDKLTIQYIVEEALESGTENIIIVTKKHKRVIEDNIDNNYEFEENLVKNEKYDR